MGPPEKLLRVPGLGLYVARVGAVEEPRATCIRWPTNRARRNQGTGTKEASHPAPTTLKFSGRSAPATLVRGRLLWTVWPRRCPRSSTIGGHRVQHRQTCGHRKQRQSDEPPWTRVLVRAGRFGVWAAGPVKPLSLGSCSSFGGSTRVGAPQLRLGAEAPDQLGCRPGRRCAVDRRPHARGAASLPAPTWARIRHSNPVQPYTPGHAQSYHDRPTAASKQSPRGARLVILDRTVGGVRLPGR